MRRSRTLVAVAVTAVAVALSGCSATVTGSPAPTGASTDSGGGAVAPTTDPVAWTDKVCGSLLPLQQSFDAPPSFDQSDPAAGIKSLSDFLGKGVTVIDQAVSGLDAAGPSPVADGDAAVAKIKTTLTTVRSSFNQAKTEIDKIDPNNVQDLITGLPKAVAPLQDLSQLKNPAADLQSNPQLDAAFAKAPNCQTLQKSG
jgi:hypothetical protein